MNSAEELVTLGRVSGVFGVRGWIKVWSDTRPRENILDYGPWQLQMPDGKSREYALEQGRVQGRGIVARLAGVADANAAQLLVGAVIAVRRSQLGAAAPGEYYWSDLEGLQVVDQAGRELGRVDGLMETGANDVLVVLGDRRRLIPFVLDQVVKSVDLEHGVLVVDWDADF